MCGQSSFWDTRSQERTIFSREMRESLLLCLGCVHYIIDATRYEGQPDKFEFGKRWMAEAEKLWAGGKWKNHPISVREGGLLGALEGLQCMREGKYSGEKLVYRVDDTEWP